MPVSPDPHAGSPAPLGRAAPLLQALTARLRPVHPCQVQTLPTGTAAPRPVLTSTQLLLPALSSPLQRAAVAHAAAHLLYSHAAQPAAGLKPLAQLVIAAVEDARVEQLLARSLPGVRAWFDAPLRSALDRYGLSCAALLSRLDFALHDEQHPDGLHWIAKARELFAAARHAHGLEDAAAFRRLASILANDLGQMRVRFEPQQFTVPCAYRDDHSYLWAQTRTRDEQPLPDTAAFDQPASTTPPAPAQPQPPWLYPEWDHRSRVLRADWCTLYEVPAPHAPALSDTPAPPRLRWPSPIASGPPLRRQVEGDTLDLEAAVDDTVRRRSGQPPTGRVFQRRARQAPPLCLLVLLDLSLSTADRPHAQAPSLLELEQAAALQLLRAGRAAGHQVAIHGFNSDTRARVRYQRLIDFGQPTDASTLARLQAARPANSTRLGAALRHACTLLARAPGPRRALLVLTDGEPSDIDVHDHRYLVEDARAAVRAAARQGLPVCGLALQATAAVYARRIFGPRGYRIASQHGQLTRQLLALHAHFSGT